MALYKALVSFVLFLVHWIFFLLNSMDKKKKWKERNANWIGSFLMLRTVIVVMYDI